MQCSWKRPLHHSLRERSPSPAKAREDLNGPPPHSSPARGRWRARKSVTEGEVSDELHGPCERPDSYNPRTAPPPRRPRHSSVSAQTKASARSGDRPGP